MDFNRRSFIAGNALIAGSLLLTQKANALGAVTKKINTVQAGLHGVNIYHSSDLNGQAASGAAGHGGLELLRKSIANAEVGGLIVDGGSFLNQNQDLTADADFIELMNRSGYHAANVGINELNKGQEQLEQLVGKMAFTLVCCNYSFNSPVLEKAVKPYVVLTYGKQKIGITGVCPETSVAGTTYLNAEKCLKATVKLLKDVEQCDKVICLSALGFNKATYCSMEIAESVNNIDFVIGSNNNGQRKHGTTVIKNAEGYDVLVSHGASMGMVLNHTAIVNNSIAISSRIPGTSKEGDIKKLAVLTNKNFSNNLNNL